MKRFLLTLVNCWNLTVLSTHSRFFQSRRLTTRQSNTLRANNVVLINVSLKFAQWAAISPSLCWLSCSQWIYTKCKPWTALENNAGPCCLWALYVAWCDFIVTVVVIEPWPLTAFQSLLLRHEKDNVGHHACLATTLSTWLYEERSKLMMTVPSNYQLQKCKAAEYEWVRSRCFRWGCPSNSCTSLKRKESLIFAKILGYSLGFCLENHTKIKLETSSQPHCPRHRKHFPTTHPNSQPLNPVVLPTSSTSPLFSGHPTQRKSHTTQSPYFLLNATGDLTSPLRPDFQYTHYPKILVIGRLRLRFVYGVHIVYK
jgi:hypothetical protein